MKTNIRIFAGICVALLFYVGIGKYVMDINPFTGIFKGAEFKLSPNHDVRPEPQDISLLVIHGISLPPGKFHTTHVIDLFMNLLKPEEDPSYEEIANLKVSTHFFIRRNGELWQFVPLHLRAWHAGASLFEGREKCNDFSIGVELEGTDDLPYEPAQYEALANLTKTLIKHYPKITPERIVGHSDIAPGRKTDPGPYFDWSRFRESIKNI